MITLYNSAGGSINIEWFNSFFDDWLSTNSSFLNAKKNWYTFISPPGNRYVEQDIPLSNWTTVKTRYAESPTSTSSNWTLNKLWLVEPKNYVYSWTQEYFNPTTNQWVKFTPSTNYWNTAYGTANIRYALDSQLNDLIKTQLKNNTVNNNTENMATTSTLSFNWINLERVDWGWYRIPGNPKVFTILWDVTKAIRAYSAEDLAKLAKSQWTTNLSQYSWWSDNPNKDQAWSLMQTTTTTTTHSN